MNTARRTIRPTFELVTEAAPIARQDRSDVWSVIGRDGQVAFSHADKATAYAEGQRLADAEQCTHFLLAPGFASSERINVLRRR